MTLVALVSVVAQADPGDALGPAARALWDEGARREGSGDLAGAALRYRAVLGVEPGFAHAAVALGRVRERQGDRAGAAEAYRAAPLDADAVESLGRLTLAEGGIDEAIASFERLRALRPESPGLTGRLAAQALAARDPDEAERRWWSAMEAPDAAFDDDARAGVLAIHDARRAAGADDAARSFALAVLARWPDVEGTEALAARVDRARVEIEAQALRAARGRPLSPPEQERLDAARSVLAGGDPRGARGALTALAGDAAEAPAVWGALADAEVAVGDLDRAEAAIAKARALAPLDPALLEQEGDLLAVAYGGREDAAAVAAWRSALRYRPSDPGLWRKVAEHAPPDEACLAWTQVARLEPGPSDAATRVVGCARRRAPEVASPSASVGEGTPGALWIARVYQREDRLDAALTEAQSGLAVTPDDAELRTLLGELQFAKGDLRAAEAAFRAALAVEPGRADTRVALGDLRERAGDPAGAEEAWRLAADAGSAEARYRLARRAWAAGRPWAARDALDAYFAGASSGPSHEAAKALRDQVERRIRSIQAAVAAIAALSVALPVGLWLVRRRRSGLDALTTAVPEVWREVAAAIGAIRHDVFKHDLGALAAVADALERGDPDVGTWMADRLAGPEGAIARFDALRVGLERLGRRHGVSLDLRRRDPLFGPICAAIDRLRRVESGLRAGDPAVAPTLRAVHQDVILDGQRRLGERLATLSVIPIDAARVQQAIDAVGAELGPVSVAVEARVDDARVRMFPGELRDVLVNLIRNAVEATRSRPDGRVGVVIDAEVDDITGLGSVVVRVRDDAPRRITTATLRARGIDRGLGLASERVARAGGAIRVEDEAGWSKAVVVRLPRVEAP